MNEKDEESKVKSAEEIRQGKRARIEKEEQEKREQISNSSKCQGTYDENQPGSPGFLLSAYD